MVDFSAKRCRWLHDIKKTDYQVTEGMHAHPDVEGQLHCRTGARSVHSIVRGLIDVGGYKHGSHQSFTLLNNATLTEG